MDHWTENVNGLKFNNQTSKLGQIKWYHKYIIYILYKIKNNYKKLRIYK